MLRKMNKRVCGVMLAAMMAVEFPRQRSGI